MKRTRLRLQLVGLTAMTSITAITTWSWSSVAHADKPPTGAVDAEFQMMNTNGDGKLSPQEHATGARKMFEAMDANHDGQVTAAEMDAAHEQMMAKLGKTTKQTDMSAADKIKKVDSNNDGVLTAAEHAAASQSMFQKMDTDKDGQLTRAELAAGHAKMMPKKSDRGG